MPPRAHVLMYLFGEQALPAKANPRWWTDKRARFRLPCTDRFASMTALQQHVLAAAIREAQDNGVVRVRVEERRARFGTRRKLVAEAGTLPAQPHPWERIMWEAASADRATVGLLAKRLDARDPADIHSRGFTLRHVQREAHELGFLREPPPENVLERLTDPDVDCDAVAAVAAEGRRFAQAWVSFRETDAAMHDLLIEAVRDGTADRTPV